MGGYYAVLEKMHFLEASATVCFGVCQDLANELSNGKPAFEILDAPDGAEDACLRFRLTGGTYSA